MRSYWIVVILAILVALGVVMVVQSQHQMVDIMNKKNEMLKTALERLSNEYVSQDLHKVTVEKLAHNSQKGVDDVNAAINKLMAEMEQKKTENDACQAQKTTAEEELERAQEIHKETKISLEAEAETWIQQIKTLKVALTRDSPVCAYVNNRSDAQKLCGKTN